MVARAARRRTPRSRRPARSGPRRHPVAAWLGRAGLAARGTLYILVGIIAVEIAVDGSHQQADKSGAVRLIAQTPLGGILLWLLAAGFAAMTLWQVSRAIWGTGEPDGGKASQRLASAGRAVIYAVIAYGVLTYALGVGQSSSSDSQSQDLTAQALKHPGGQVIVAIAGIVITGAGLYFLYQGFRMEFRKHLRFGSASPATRKMVIRLGQIGTMARGVVYGTIGVFGFIAAVNAKPQQAKGIDSALRALAHTPLGPWLLLVVALGLATFGVYSWCEAKWREV